MRNCRIAMMPKLDRLCDSLRAHGLLINVPSFAVPFHQFPPDATRQCHDQCLSSGLVVYNGLRQTIFEVRCSKRNGVTRYSDTVLLR
eukprot:COSAG02_NODE_1090_length_14647_cov_122.569425_14_plen_87_part_00